MERKLQQAQGNWVVGERFWGREDDIRILTRKIDEGAHISLIAQRRMGKTSLMKELQRRLSDRYICLFIDLQKDSDPADVIARFSLSLKPYDSLWKKVKSVFANVWGAVSGNLEEVSFGEIGIKLRAGLNQENWMEKGDALFSILAKSDRPVLLMIDEVPLMVNRMLKGDDYVITRERIAEVDRFMSWLRANSIEHQGKIVIMLSGSIGFEPVLRQAKLSSTINNYQPYDLRPWDDETAIGCLSALGQQYGVEFQNRAEEAMVRKLGYCIPHHVQLFFSHLLDRCERRGEMRFSADDVDDLYEHEMLGIRGHAELAHYQERLELFFSKEQLPLVLAILTETAIAGKLEMPVLRLLQREYARKEVDSDEETMEILRVLEHDGYLRKSGEEYRYESNLLKEWWKKAHSGFYVPLKEREK
ncbi:MAG: ATP-binding protein [Chlorobium sp.]|nr:MAG: ATP-binding protein [Chlorobium sp.]